LQETSLKPPQNKSTDESDIEATEKEIKNSSQIETTLSCTKNSYFTKAKEWIDNSRPPINLSIMRPCSIDKYHNKEFKEISVPPASKAIPFTAKEKAKDTQQVEFHTKNESEPEHDEEVGIIETRTPCFSVHSKSSENISTFHTPKEGDPKRRLCDSESDEFIYVSEMTLFNNPLKSTTGFPVRKAKPLMPHCRSTSVCSLPPNNNGRVSSDKKSQRSKKRRRSSNKSRKNRSPEPCSEADSVTRILKGNVAWERQFNELFNSPNPSPDTMDKVYRVVRNQLMSPGSSGQGERL
jgi:hypothetical protein